MAPTAPLPLPLLPRCPLAPVLLLFRERRGGSRDEGIEGLRRLGKEAPTAAVCVRVDFPARRSAPRSFITTVIVIVTVVMFVATAGTGAKDAVVGRAERFEIPVVQQLPEPALKGTRVLEAWTGEGRMERQLPMPYAQRRYEQPH